MAMRGDGGSRITLLPITTDELQSAFAATDTYLRCHHLDAVLVISDFFYCGSL